MTDIFTLGLKADTTDLERGSKRLDELADKADRAEGRTKKLRDGVNTAATAVATFGSVSVAALGGIAAAAADAAREIDNLSRLTSQTTDDFQRTAFAARAYGVEQDKLADILKDTQDKVGDFLTTGAGPMVDFFEQVAPLVGVTAEQFRGLNGKEALQLYVDSLERANLSQSEMVFYMEAIASDATLLLPLLSDSGAEMSRLADRADELGVVLDELDLSNLNDLKTSLGEVTAIAAGLSNVVGATLAPYLTDLTQKLTDNADAADTVRDATMSVVEVGVIVAGVYADAGRVFEIAGKSLGAFAFQVVESFSTIEDRLKLAQANYWTFATEFDLITAEWVNGLLEKGTEGVEDLVNVFTDGINELIEAVADSGLGDLLEQAGLQLESISRVEIEAPTIDTTGITESLDYWRGEQERLETAVDQSNQHIKDAWQDVLDLMAQPLPSDQFDEWFDSITKMVREQRKLQDEIKKTGKTQIKTAGESADAVITYDDKKTKSEIDGLKDVTRIAQQAFSERSSAREALNRAEQAFTAIELALSFKRASANALEAISSAFAAPFPLNFAAGAAMIGIMAGLGLFSGSGGGTVDPTQGRQDDQGTGTVLGDSAAKSDSISASAERLEDIQIDQLAELRGIRTGLRALSSGIEKLARDVVSNMRFNGEFAGQFGEVNTGFTASLGESLQSIPVVGGLLGGIIGGFSSTKKELLDSGIAFFSQTLGEILESGQVEAAVFAEIKTTKESWWGLSSSDSTKIEYQDIDSAITGQMADIFGFIGDSVIGAATSLGFETANVTRVLVDEVWEDVVQQVRGGAHGQMITTGVISTLISEAITENVDLALSDAIKEFEIDLPMISLEGLSGDEIQAELEAVFSQQADLITEFLVPAITEYQQVGEGAFDTLIRVSQEQAIFNDALAMMGVSLSDLTNTMQIDIAQSVLELVGGVDEFTSLMQSFVAEFFTEAEQFEILTNSVTEAVESLGVSMFETRDQYRAMVEGVDLTTEAGRSLYAALLELNPALDQYFDVLEDNAAAEAAEAEAELAAAQREAADAARDAADAARELEQAASSAFNGVSQSIKAAQRALQDQLKDELSEIGADFDARRQQLTDTLSGTLDELESSYTARRDEVQSRVERQVASLEAQANVVSDQISKLSSLSTSLATAVDSVRGVSRAEATGQIQEAIAAARRGVNLSRFDLSQAIGTVTNIDEQTFGSALGYVQERARTANQLTELKKLGDGQLSQAERSAMMIERQISAVQSSGESQIEALEAAQAAAEEEAQRLHDEQMAHLDELQAQAEAEAEQRFQDQYDTLQQQLDAARDQLDALLGIDSSVQSVEDALAAFNATLAEALAAQEYAAQLAADQAAETEQTQQAAIAELEQQVAQLQNDEAAVSPAFVGPMSSPVQRVETSDQTTGDFTSAEVLRSIAATSAKTAKILDRWDGDGQPEVRTA